MAHNQAAMSPTVQPSPIGSAQKRASVPTPDSDEPRKKARLSTNASIESGIDLARNHLLLDEPTLLNLERGIRKR